MIARSIIIGWVGWVPFFLVGCQDGSFSFNYHEREPGKRTHVHVAHTCTPACTHYYDGDRVVALREVHHHGHGCGHHFDGVHWVIVTHRDPQPVVIHKAPARVVVPPPPPRRVEVREHRHGPSCGCVFDRAGSKWVAAGHGHVHGPRCGHVFVSGRWTTRN